MKRAISGLAITVMVMGVCHGGAAQSEIPSPPFIKIGAIIPLTGSSSAFGNACRRGITESLEGLSTEERSRITVVIEDDGLVNSRSITAAQKLINVDRVDALLTWSSGTALAVGGLSDTRHIPQLAVASDPAVTRGHRYSFTYWPIPETETRTLYDYLKHSGKKRLSMVTQESSFTIAMRDALVAHITRGGEMTIVGDEMISSDVTDLRAILLRLKNKGPSDGFIVACWPGQLALVVKQAREVGITAPLFGYETFEDKPSFDAAGGLFTGAIYSMGADPRQDFLDTFSRKYPGESYYTANHCYDIIRLFTAATRERKDGASIRAFLSNLRDYPTVSGVISATGDNRFTLPTTLKTLDSQGIPRALTP
ncbi:MAG: hypothetical protein RL518_293 [Pseudomonadota bacterium]|jgi:branched-chain amino acid transport system substrate-binding protein